MPTNKTILNFQHHFKKLPIPFVVYADFECFTKPINSCQPNPNHCFTQEYKKHEPSGYCLYLKGLDGIGVRPSLGKMTIFTHHVRGLGWVRRWLIRPILAWKVLEQ